MFRKISIVVFCCSFVLPLFAQETELPIKRVVLYKSGVGYFEHVGQVHGNQNVGISFTSGQLNDVLKSVTVLDLNGGHIGGIAYGSAAPAGKQLSDLHLPLGDKSTLTEFLTALRGAKLEVHNGTSVVVGRLLSVERKTRMGSGATLEVDYLSLITDTGEVKTAEVSPSFSVRLLERGLAGKVDKFLNLLASSRDADIRHMTISAEGSGDRQLFVSYISEVPVWKATYRLVLPSKTGQAPLLQGWAIVDNTAGQDWENVQLSLIAGAPQSFIQNLSQPYYSQRPVVALPGGVSMVPQTFQPVLIPGETRITGKVTDASGGPIAGASVRVYETSGSMAGEAVTDAGGNYQIGVPPGTYGLQIQGAGFQTARLTGVAVTADGSAPQDVQLKVGSVSDSVTVTAGARKVQTESAMGTRLGSGRSLGRGSTAADRESAASARFIPPPSPAAELADARARSVPAASAQEMGDLFEFRLKEPVTIRKNQSQLVPIVQAPIGVEKVSVWNERANFPRPLRALWLTNSTGLTLDGGTFSVLEDEAFAGEGIVDPIRPDEKRLVTYATDLALTVSADQKNEAQKVVRVAIHHGMMMQQSSLREVKTYTFRNQDTTARTVIVEHPVRPGYQLNGSIHPAETTASWMRFRVRVEPKQTTSLTLDESKPLSSTVALSSLNAEQVAFFAQQKSIDRTVEEALKKILAVKTELDNLQAKLSANEEESTKIFDDQERLRENMKALKGSAEEKSLLQRYTRQLNEEEDRLDALKKETGQLEAQRDRVNGALDRMVEELSMEVVL